MAYKGGLCMLFNIIVGMIIPWLFAIYLIKNTPKIFFLIFPIGALFSHIINTLGLYFNFWHIKPLKSLESLNFLIYDIGLFAILATYLIYVIAKKRCKTHNFYYFFFFYYKCYGIFYDSFR